MSLVFPFAMFALCGSVSLWLLWHLPYPAATVAKAGRVTRGHA